MTRIETIQTLLGIKDTVYGLLEWAEQVSDEDFEQHCKVAHALPEEVLTRLEDFCRLSKGFGNECGEIITKINEICAASGNPECAAKETS